MGNNRLSLRIHKRNGIIHPFALFVMVSIALGEDYTVRVMFNKIAQMLSLGTDGGTVLMYGIFGIFFLFHLGDILNGLVRKNACDAFGVIILGVIGWIVAVYHGLDDTVLLANESFTKVFLFYIPIYLLSRSLNNYEIIENYLWIYAYICLFFCMYVFAQSQLALQQGYDTHMTLGYQLTLVSMILFSTFLKTSGKKLIHWVHLGTSVFAMVFVVAYGSRGSLITILLYVLYLMFKDIDLKSLRLWHFLCVCVCLMFVIFSEQLLMLVVDVFDQWGINSRTIAWLLRSDSQLNSSGRDIILLNAIKAVGINPMIGYGLFGDRLVVGQYAHNLFFEILIDYGILLGGIMCIVFISKMVKVLKEFGMMSTCAIYVASYLMFSNSFLRTGVFWFVLGYLMSQGNRRIIRVRKKETTSW